MSDEHEFRIRPGRIRSTRAQSSRPFIAQALAAAQKAGGSVSRSGRIGTGKRSQFGRGRAASVQANRFLTGRSRLATIKTRVVRHAKRGAPLATHLNYLRREGVTRDDAKARMFGPEVDDASTTDFVDRCKDDRHHFRFIVSPEDAVEMADLKSFTRDLMGRMQKDLGTTLDWIAVDHWNTDNPHVHVILRGRADDGQDLVISRDYISRGMRDRASDLVTQELGPRSDLEIRRHVERQVEAERWTGLDRQLLRDARDNGVIDLAPHADRQPDEFIAPKIGRLRRLETLGLAEQLGPGQWIVSERAEATLRQMGERGDIVKRMHRAFAVRDIERPSASYVLAAENVDETIVGRLIIEFPRGIVQGEMPPIFVIGADGEAEITNSRVYQNILIVDRLFGAAELRLGAGKRQQAVRIVRVDRRTDGLRRGPSDSAASKLPNATHTGAPQP
ncbi:DUF3363 domain-containing protein [Mesorhizobium sp. B1-1-5]|nr:DUF3363 domain-containing protein [Mesorhizobium sp. B1-1-5]